VLVIISTSYENNLNKNIVRYPDSSEFSHNLAFAVAPSALQWQRTSRIKHPVSSRRSLFSLIPRRSLPLQLCSPVAGPGQALSEVEWAQNAALKIHAYSNKNFSNNKNTSDNKNPSENKKPSDKKNPSDKKIT